VDAKSPSASHTQTTELVLPNDTNGLGNMMGGRLLHLMDKCASISAQRHAGKACVTASVDNVEFQAPIYQNDVVVIESQVNRAFRTSMEVELNVWAEAPRQGTRRKCNRAYYTFVALSGEDGAPTEAPPLRPETTEERARYESAAKRRELRLLLAGRLDLEDASHIQDDLLGTLRERS
jgi:acyl-CoA hydrolase